MRGEKVTGNRWQVIGNTLRRKGLHSFHKIVCRVDDWCFKQEAKYLPPTTCHPIPTPSVDRVASSIREHARRRVAKFQKLKYAGGQFVRTEPL